MKGHGFQLVRRFRASPERVFAACSEPAFLLQWLGPDDFRAVDVHVDLRVGGVFSFRMVGPDGGTMGAAGVYEAVDPPRLLVHTWQWTQGNALHPQDGGVSRVRFEIAPDGDGACLTFTHEALPDDEAALQHREGWREALGKLDDLLAGQPQAYDGITERASRGATDV